eukprot:XP_001704067.1 VSP [Giardia lamblia ATCC 50803]
MGGCYDKCPYGNGADTNTCADAPAGPASCNPQSPDATSCAPDSCNVVIEGQTFCSKCTGGKVPVNGECKAKGDAPLCTAGANAQEGTCAACTGAQRLYMGGCYDKCPYGNGADANTCADAPAGCNTPNCKACDNPKTDNEVCTECNDGNYLTPTSQCVSDCTTLKGYYGDDSGKKTCKKCNDACAECKGADANQCTACPAGKMLQYTDENSPSSGTCVDGCKPQSGASGCEICGATIGGTKYCSKCSTSTEVPVNGVCKADNARAPVCSKKDNQGGCATCASGYFRQDNGCYKTDRQPGIQICTLASSAGKCETCANSLQPNDGACPSCHSTCKTCSAADSSDKCTSCAAGYYMVGSAAGPCTSCDSNSGSVKGVAGCLNCAPPSSSTGSVLCYLMNGDSAGGSTNKSGLSTGAIAGISVAVIVVVGGLVGFLCWWFLCRGKA